MKLNEVFLEIFSLILLPRVDLRYCISKSCKKISIILIEEINAIQKVYDNLPSFYITDHEYRMRELRIKFLGVCWIENVQQVGNVCESEREQTFGFSKNDRSDNRNEEKS